MRDLALVSTKFSTLSCEPNTMNKNTINNIEKLRVGDKEKHNTLAEYILFLKMKKAYEFAKSRCIDKNILDYGCGTGYGAYLLSESAKTVCGVDIDRRAIECCTEKYKASNLSFLLISGRAPLPFDKDYFDAIVSFQVIEHIHDVNGYLLELKRMLKSNGFLFITTPNRKYRLSTLQKPWNREHLREYTKRTFLKTLGNVFKEPDILALYGTEEVNKIEHDRVKWLKKSYLESLASCVKEGLKKHVLEKIPCFFKLRNLPTSQKSQKDFIITPEQYEKYTKNDFQIGKNFKIALDLLGVCRK
jgi:2-polyprenyl-3-methyl-5-hydroxy-6-metoxy-1,4-benzoquinol methylase